MGIKNQYKFYCILGCVKMTNFEIRGVNNEKFKNHQISLEIFLFCVGQNTNYLF
jgi:hypothetical protein